MLLPFAGPSTVLTAHTIEDGQVEWGTTIDILQGHKLLKGILGRW